MGETWKDDGVAMVMMMASIYPLRSPKQPPRLDLPRKNRGGGSSATENRNIDFCFRVSSSRVKIPAEGGAWGEAPLDQATWWHGQGDGPPSAHLLAPGIFYC